jgi:hypothetical protein
MKPSVVIAVGVACIAGGGLRGQATYPYLGELKQNYTIVKTNLIRMAEKVPPEHYGFKPVAEIRFVWRGRRPCSRLTGAQFVRWSTASRRLSTPQLRRRKRTSWARSRIRTQSATRRSTLYRRRREPDGQARAVNA